MANAQDIEFRVKSTLISIRNNIPDWADAVVFVVGYATLTACIDPRCFRPIISWVPVKRNKFGDNYYYSSSWRSYRILLEQDELQYLSQRGIGYGPYLMVLGNKVEIYTITIVEKKHGQYTTITPKEKILEL
jgi:hypothetical protein